MRMRGGGGSVVRFLGMAVLSCGVLLLSVSGGLDKRARGDKVTRAATETRHTASKNYIRGTSSVTGAFGKLPLSFEENQGQTAREVRYVSHGAGYELFLTSQEAVVALQRPTRGDLSILHRAEYFQALRRAHKAGRTTVVRMGLEGANLEAKIFGNEPLLGRVNYFIGNKPERWHTDIPTYARVKYVDIYPGVDLVFYGDEGKLEYDFVVAPGADPKSIAFTLKGTRNLRVNSAGELVLGLPGGQMAFEKPVIYQMSRGRRKQVEGGYVLDGKQRVTFSVSNYDRSEALIIDPVLNYSTYLGGSSSGNDVGSSITVDSQGDAFIVGTTFSTTFPTHNGFGAGNSTFGVASVTELNPSGTALLYSTYLGGTGGESGLGIAIDPSGNTYVAGITFSTDFPTTVTALKPASPGASAGTSFVSKINPTLSGSASLIYSSYLGGINGAAPFPDFANAVAADANGNAYITGYTDSSPGSGASDFPITPSAFQSTLGSSAGNAFLTKIDTTQSGALSLIYSTYLGGSGADATSSSQDFGEIAFGLALGTSNNVYLAGTTTSTDFPTTSTAFQPNTAPPAAVAHGTAFLSKIDTTLSGAASLIYSTYLGGDVAEFGTVIAVKPNSTVAYVTGTTSSPAFPTFPANTFQTAGATVFPAAFVSLLDTSLPAGTALTYSTFLGGNNSTGFGIQADAAGNAYIGGGTASTTFPLTTGALQPAFAAGAISEGFVAKLSPGGNGAADLLYSTFFGGSGLPATSTSAALSDRIDGIAIDGSNNVYITGVTFSTTTFPVFPSATATTPAFQTSMPTGATSAAFVTKLTLIPTVTVTPTSLDFGTQPVGTTSVPQTVTLTNNTSDPIPFANSALAFNGSNAADFASPSNTCGTSIAAGASCNVSVTFTPSVASPESATLVITVTITDGGIASSQSFSVALSGTGSAVAPGVGLTPARLIFGGQLLTTTSAAQMVTLKNTGNAPLTINATTNGIATSGDFAQTNNCPLSPQTLAGGASCTINVTFAPTAVGARTGTLTINDNAGGSPQTLPLNGTGWDFTITAPASATVKRGKTTTFNVTMTPLGGFNQAVALACSGEPMKSSCAVVPTSVTASDGTTAQTAAVTFTAKGLVVPLPTTPARPLSWRQIVPLLLALLLLFMLFTVSRLSTRMGMVAAILILVSLAGCASSNATKKGTFPLTITGTSGGVTKTITVTLTVN